MALQQDDDLWSLVLGLLPEDFEATARQCGVFQRKREIRSAQDLLRMILVYGVTDLSMQSVCAWASSVGMASMSKPAFFYRMRRSSGWLMHLLEYVLRSRAAEELGEAEGLRVKIVDATCVQGPGAEGTEWRIHARIMVDSSGERWRMESLQISDEHVGESYGIHGSEPGELILGDRGYGTAQSIWYALEEGSKILVRITASAIRVCDSAKAIIDLKKYEQLVPEQGCYSMGILIPVPPRRTGKRNGQWSLNKARGWIDVRLIGSRNDEGEVVWIVTTLPESVIEDEAAMGLYRIRWQIELMFKRLKSLAWLDKVPSPHKGPTAMSWIAARLLAAALVEALNDMANRSFSP